MTALKWPLMQNNITWGDKWSLVKFILTTDRYTQGTKVAQFEQQWNTWLGSNHSLFVTSGSTANFLLVAACMEMYDIPRGSKILLPACTWMTNVAPPMQLGLEPVFCDINLQDYCYDYDALKQVARQNPDIRMVFVSHLLGLRGDVEKIQEIFPQAILIEDICESHGCSDDYHTKAGAHSVGATFSFYFGHHMTSIEGGMVSTNNPELYDLMKMKRSHGMARHSAKADQYQLKHPEIDPSFLFVTDGYNFRNTELGAVLGMSQLKRLDDFVQIRRRNYFQVMQILNRYGMLFEYHKPQCGNSSFCFPIICHSTEIKHEFIQSCRKHGVEYRPVVSGNLLQQPFLQKYSNQIVPNAQKLHENGVYIGNNQFVGEQEFAILETICKEINR